MNFDLKLIDFYRTSNDVERETNLVPSETMWNTTNVSRNKSFVYEDCCEKLADLWGEMQSAKIYIYVDVVYK